LNKYAQKLLKLQTKAQECVSREKAKKIIKKERKLHEKTKAVEKELSRSYNSLV